MKIAINTIILIAMIASMAVQYNDPDGIVWAIIYGYAAVMAISALRNKYNAPMLIIGIIAYSIGTFILFPADLQGWITNELAREAGGLAITALCLITLLIQKYTTNSSDEPAAVYPEPTE